MSLLQGFIQRIAVVNQDEADSDRKFLNRIREVGEDFAVFYDVSVFDPSFDEHGSLCEVPVFETDRQRRISLSVHKVILYILLQ